MKTGKRFRFRAQFQSELLPGPVQAGFKCSQRGIKGCFELFQGVSLYVMKRQHRPVVLAQVVKCLVQALLKEVLFHAGVGSRQIAR